MKTKATHVFARLGVDRIALADLARHLSIPPRQLSRKLGMTPRKFRIGGVQVKGFFLADFQPVSVPREAAPVLHSSGTEISASAPAEENAKPERVGTDTQPVLVPLEPAPVLDSRGTETKAIPWVGMPVVDVDSDSAFYAQALYRGIS